MMLFTPARTEGDLLERRSERSRVTAEAERANGGNITLGAGSLARLISSQLAATVKGGEGSGGNVLIEAPLLTVEGSQIRADAFGGPGGNIRLEAGVFRRESLISASSALGIPGTVVVQAPVTSLSGTFTPLPQTFMDVATLLAARCAARAQDGRYSSLVLGGRGGLPPEPGGVLPSPLALGEQLVADPALTGALHRHPSPSRFALLAGQEKALPRLQGHPLASGCPK